MTATTHKDELTLDENELLSRRDTTFLKLCKYIGFRYSCEYHIDEGIWIYEYTYRKEQTVYNLFVDITSSPNKAVLYDLCSYGIQSNQGTITSKYHFNNQVLSIEYVDIGTIEDYINKLFLVEIRENNINNILLMQ